MRLSNQPSLKILIASLICFAFACSDSKSPRSSSSPKPTFNNGTSQNTTTPLSTSSPLNTGSVTSGNATLNSSNNTSTLSPTVRPKILVVGWGPTSCQPFIDWMVEDGFPKEHAYLFKYSYTKDLETVKQELSTQFNEVFAKYAPNVKFDVIGLSTGHFVGLYTMMETNIDARVERFIGGMGIAHGINSIGADYHFPNIIYSYDDPAYASVVGETIAAISPHMNPFLTSFYQKYDARIRTLKKCSVFSPQDSLVSPYDTGKFDDGENFSIPNLRHITSLNDKDGVYGQVFKNCYKSSWTN